MRKKQISSLLRTLSKGNLLGFLRLLVDDGTDRETIAEAIVDVLASKGVTEEVIEAAMASAAAVTAPSPATVASAVVEVSEAVEAVSDAIEELPSRPRIGVVSLRGRRAAMAAQAMERVTAARAVPSKRMARAAAAAAQEAEEARRLTEEAGLPPDAFSATWDDIADDDVQPTEGITVDLEPIEEAG